MFEVSWLEVWSATLVRTITAQLYTTLSSISALDPSHMAFEAQCQLGVTYRDPSSRLKSDESRWWPVSSRFARLTEDQVSVRNESIMRFLHQMTILEELQARLLAKVGPGTDYMPISAKISRGIPSQFEEPAPAWSSIAPNPLDASRKGEE
jgi:hypothetical protein